ncbi:hypothetical protein ACFC5X_19945 [Streptomyces sp. NPDC055952]|uniref:hypothetical protein n=1 Tax=Streptomyces sp. NPDC055952 TaxID=3345663 RepID=UPI0035D5F65C
MEQISNAASQLTGESLEDVRRRMGRLTRYDVLIPGASPEQALLEAVLASALGGVDGQTRPLGVRQAKPVDGGLALRLERSKDAQALLELLPCRRKKGPWRGVRGVTVRMDGGRLRFGLRSWGYQQSWRSSAPAVWVAGPHGEDLAALLAAHAERLAATKHVALWDPQCDERGPGRREPVTRDLLRRLTASSALGSALLRRPRLWDRLAGHATLRLTTEMTDYGLDWSIDRQVVGDGFDEDRLLDVLKDHIVGFGLRLLEHACGAEACTMRMAPASPGYTCRGVLTIRSSRAVALPPSQAPAPRPFTIVGEGRRASRPRRDQGQHEAEPASSGTACVIQLVDAPSNGIGRDHLAWVAERVAAGWAAQGACVGLLLVEADTMGLFGDPGRPDWATAPVPTAAKQWTRLRLTPPPGQLWSLTVPNTSDKISTALKDARHAFDQVLLIGAYDGLLQDTAPPKRAPDLRILVHHSKPYQRRISIPGRATSFEDGVPLTPTESAVQWRQENLGRWVSTQPLDGLLLLTHPEAAQQDEFDAAVEEHLARYGTPVLGHFPDHGLIIRGHAHSTHPPTLLDPPAAPTDHPHMATAAERLLHRVRGNLPPTVTKTTTQKAPDLSTLLS